MSKSPVFSDNPEMNETTEKEGVSSYDFIFSKVKFGVIILNFKKRKIIYKNKHFNLVARGQDNQIIKNIYRFIKKKELLTIEQKDILISLDSLSFVIGVSGYRIDKNNFLIFLKDISAKKITEERQHMNQFYSDFSKVIAEFSHEVGNPLSTIDTTLQVILNNFDHWNSEKTKDYLTKTITEIKRVSEFLKHVRIFSIEENIKIKQVNLRKAIEMVLKRNELFLSSYNVLVDLKIDAEIDVMIDEDAFYQVMFNFIKNSIDAFKNIKNRRVSIAVDGYNEYFVKLVFKNNGKPLNDEIIEKIFTPFFSTKERGRGMGLPISLKLMTLMGGTIKAVLPEDETGAEFNLYIPCKRI